MYTATESQSRFRYLAHSDRTRETVSRRRGLRRLNPVSGIWLIPILSRTLSGRRSLPNRLNPVSGIWLIPIPRDGSQEDLLHPLRVSIPFPVSGSFRSSYALTVSLANEGVSPNPVSGIWLIPILGRRMGRRDAGRVPIPFPVSGSFRSKRCTKT